MILSYEELTHEVIGAAIEVHRVVGPGLLDSVYAACLAAELRRRRVQFDREFGTQVIYKGEDLGLDMRADLVVEGTLLVEVKAVAVLLDVHTAQAITYMRMLDLPIGLLLNFHHPLMSTGIKRLMRPRLDSSVTEPRT